MFFSSFGRSKFLAADRKFLDPPRNTNSKWRAAMIARSPRVEVVKPPHWTLWPCGLFFNEKSQEWNIGKIRKYKGFECLGVNKRILFRPRYKTWFPVSDSSLVSWNQHESTLFNGVQVDSLLKDRTSSFLTRSIEGNWGSNEEDAKKGWQTPSLAESLQRAKISEINMVISCTNDIQDMVDQWTQKTSMAGLRCRQVILNYSSWPHHFLRYTSVFSLLAISCNITSLKAPHL